MKYCLFNKSAPCRFAPCTEAQHVSCCLSCPYRKTCQSGCDRIKRSKAETKKKPQAEETLPGQITMEV